MRTAACKPHNARTRPPTCFIRCRLRMRSRSISSNPDHLLCQCRTGNEGMGGRHITLTIPLGGATPFSRKSRVWLMT